MSRRPEADVSGSEPPTPASVLTPELAVFLSDRTPRREMPSQMPVELVYFGSSPKRLAVAEYVAEHFEIHFLPLPGGPEPEDVPTVVAAEKINHGLTVELRKLVKPTSRKLRAVVAGDVVVVANVFRNNIDGGKVVPEIKGKPEKLSVELPQLFQDMIRTFYKMDGDLSYYSYSIMTGSQGRVIRGLNTIRTIPDVLDDGADYVSLGLDPDFVEYCSSIRGSRVFTDITRKLLESSAYLSGHSSKSSPAEACAGLEAATIAMFGGFTSINGESVTDERLAHVLDLAYYGLKDNIFSVIHPDAPKIAREYKDQKIAGIIDYIHANVV